MWEYLRLTNKQLFRFEGKINIDWLTQIQEKEADIKFILKIKSSS